MAQTNPFLQSPYDSIASQDDQEALLPGQQSVTKPAPLPQVKAAAQPAESPAPAEQTQPVEKVAAEQPAETRRPAKASNYMPPPNLLPVFEKAAQEYDVPVNVLMALGHQESRYNPAAIGQPTEWGRAKGMMQYLDSTAKGMGINPFDPAQAIPAAAKQLRERLDRGETMIDAVREHFAGPDRKKWGTKTAAYGDEVMAKAFRIGGEAPGQSSTATAPSTGPSTGTDTTVPADWVRLTPEQAAEIEANSAGTPATTSSNIPAEDPKKPGFLDEYVVNPLKRGFGSFKQSAQATVTMADARQLEVMGRIDRGEKVPDQQDVVGYQYMNPQQRAEYKTLYAKNFQSGAENIAALGKEVAAIPQDPEVAAASNAKSFDEWWQHFKKAPIKFIAQTGVESLPNMVPGLVLGAGAGVAANMAMKGGALVAGAAGMGAGSYATDYPSTVMSALGDLGVDTANPDALTKAFSDPKLMEDVRKQAHAHASVVGALDAVSGGRAGATIVAGKTIAKKAANMALKTGEQGVLGASGEAGGQVAQGKDQLEWGNIMGEFAGEVAGAPAEIAGATYAKAKDAVAARRAQAQAEPQPAAQPAPQAAAQPTPSAQPAPAAQPTPEQAPPPPPAAPSGPLTASVEAAAEQHAPQPQRVTVTAPNGQQGSGTLAGYQEDADGNFVAQIQGDDGQVHTLTSADGVTLQPEAPQDSGPMTAALSAAADRHADDPAPAPVRPEKPAAPDYASMELPALRARLKYIADQAKQSGWDKRFMDARREVERAINAKTAEAKTASKPAEEPLTAGPFDQRSPANKMMLRYAERTGQPHEVIEADGKFTVKPIKESHDAGVDTASNVPAVANEAPAGAATAAAQPGDQQGRVSGAAQPAPERGADTGAPAASAGSAIPGDGAHADAQPALKPGRQKADEPPLAAGMTRLYHGSATHGRNDGKAWFSTSRDYAANYRHDAELQYVDVPTERINKLADPDGYGQTPDKGFTFNAEFDSSDVGPRKPLIRKDQAAEKDPHAGRWFSTPEKAAAYIDRSGAADTHEAVQTGKVRFEVKPKPEATPKVSHLDEARQKHQRQDDEVRKAADNIARRKAEKEAVAPASAIDAAANEAATSDANDHPAPTPAQIEAGNYKKGHISVHGLDITIENPRGSARSGTDPDGKAWSHTMSDHYGYVKRTTGADGEQVDVYIGPKPDSQRVYVVDQIDQGTGKFDEHKAMLGYTSRQQAVAAYKSNFDAGWKVGPVKGMSIDEFKAWLKDGDTSKPADEHAAEQVQATDEAPAAEPIAEAQHQDAGRPAEPATAEVVAESVDQAAKAEGTRPSDMRKWLVAEIDKAIAAAPQPDPTITLGKPYTSRGKVEFTGKKGTVGEHGFVLVTVRQVGNGQWTMSATNGAGRNERIRDFKAENTAAARRMAETLLDRAYLEGAQTRIGEPKTVTFDVPGDGNFTVPNVPAELEAFKKRVLASPGFKDGRATAKASPAEPEPEAANDELPTSAVVDEPPPAEEPAKRRIAASRSGTLKPEQSKIADFGEKLGGAKKDLWSGFKDDLNAVADEDIAAQPLSKVWPAPDYQKLIDGGMEAEAVAVVRALRDEVPAKPRAAWKVKRWAEQVKTLRDFANSVMDGETSPAELRQKMAGIGLLRGVAGRIDLYLEVGHAKSLEGVRFQQHHYSIYRGQENVDLWVAEKDQAASAFSNWPREIATGKTKDEAIADFKAKYAGLDADKANKQPSFDIFSERGVKAYFIGKKIGRNYAKLAGPFDSVKEARAYRDEQAQSLADKLEKFKEIPRERRDVNEPRVGEDMRNGQDVMPEMFADTFQFRGVEFGNWVEQKRRQQDLNDAFDALMDMAAVLGIPPAALSLNGQLGLAFGARGSGGVNPAAAHYEPGKIVINLTKRSGAGSLGHEWWHALDNYFSRLRAKPDQMMTEALDVSLAARGSDFIDNTPVRKQMIVAFGEVVRAIKQTAIKARSAKLDAKRTKEYWTTGAEMSARAFESYLISKLQDQNASNDYLANIVSEKTWAAAEALGFELDSSYPYPTAGEIPVIRAAFGRFFQTVETREEAGRPVMYSVADDDGGTSGTSPDILGAILDGPLGAAALTGKQDSEKISDATLNKVREQYGDIEHHFEAAAGHGFDALTESEGRYLANFRPVDAIRNRIVARGQQEGDEAGARAAAGRESRQGNLSGTGLSDQNSVAGAIRRLMAAQSGEATIQRDGLGSIAIHYGDKDWGLAHIAARRGEAFMERLPELLATGDVYTKPGQPDRVFIGNERDEAVIRLDHSGKPGNWLLTAYEKHPVTRQSRTDEAAPFEKLSDKELKSALTAGPVGSVIARLIEHGTIVIHRSAKTLPKEVKVKGGVQAVTMPDGSMHLVAGALTKDNARAVLLHEMFHGGVRPMLGDKAWGDLMGRMGSLYRQSEQSGGRAREFFDRARDRVAIAKARGAVPTRMEVEEFAAYAIEEYERARDSLPAAIRKWVEDLSGLVKAYIAKRYGKQIGKLTPAQLSGLAKMAILDMAAERRGEMFGPAGELFSSSADKTVEVDGVQRPITTSEGKLIATEFPAQAAFWRWFKDSAVVDKHGRPLVVYHGTRGDFSAFDPKTVGNNFGADDRGFFFISDPKQGSDYATSDNVGLSAYEGGSVIPAFVSLQKPMIIDDAFLRSEGMAPIGKTEDVITFWDNYQALIHEWMDDRKSDGAILVDNSYQPNGEPTKMVVALKPTQIKSATGNNGGFDPNNPDIRYSVAGTDAQADASTTDAAAEPAGLTPPEQGLLRRVQASVQDNMNRAKQVQERIMDVTGRTVLGKSDYYGAETNRPGRIAARLEDARDQLTGPLMEKLAKSGHTQEQLSELLHAMHAHERNERVASINPDMPDGGSGMTDAQAAAIIERYKDAGKLHELANEARAIAKATLDLKLAYGLLKADDHATLSTIYENYVPLKGDGEYGPKVKRAMGHEERDEHILENIARDYDQAVVVGEKNLARQSLLQMVLQFKDDTLWTARVPPRGRYVAGKVYDVMHNGQKVASFTSQPQVAAFLEAKGAQAGAYEVQDSNGERVAEFVKPLQDNEVMVYVKGDPVRIQIHDEVLARQLRPLNSEQLHPILNFMRWTNRQLSKIYTGYNPTFILKNATRDAMTGTINMLGNNGAAVAAKAWTKYPSAAKTIGQWAATKNMPDTKTGRYLTEYRQHGGKVGASYMSDLDEQGKKLTTMYEDAYGAGNYLATGQTLKAAKVAGRKVVGGMAHVVEIANQATENALRLSLFMALREEGVSAGNAAQAAKSVTVDFDRKGASTGALGSIYLFFNPAVQGTANAIKTLAKGEHKEQAWAALGGLALLGVYAASQGIGDDKDRWLGEEWDTRTRNFILNIGGHQLRLPLSQEFAPVYAFGVALAEGWHGESKMRSAVRVVSSFLDAYFPLNGAFKEGSDNPMADLALAATPTMVKPLTEAAMNRNSFGNQVVPDNELTKDRPDNLKMFRGTKNSLYDKAAQGIASFGELTGAGKYENDITKVSPETLKSLWRTYTGGLGTFVTDSLGLAGMAISDPGQVEGGDVPFWKDFVKDKDVKPIRGRYFDLARDAHKAITEFEQAKKAGDGEALDKLMTEDKARLVGLGRMVRSVSKSAAALGDEKVSINADPKLTGSEKRAKLKEIEQDEEALYRSGIAAFR